MAIREIVGCLWYTALGYRLREDLYQLLYNVVVFIVYRQEGKYMVTPTHNGDLDSWLCLCLPPLDDGAT